MELHQLEYLVAVADTGSFTRAAERLHVSQPGVSAQLKKLESELGEVLLDRTRRGVVPTQVGETVLLHARAALAEVQSVRDAVHEHTGMLRGSVSVGVIGSGLPPELPDLLASFAQEHPAVEITMTQGLSHQRVAAVLDGTHDAAIVGLVGDPPDGIARQLLRDEPTVLGVSPDDPLAGRKRVTLAEAARRPLIALPVGTGLRTALDEALADLGLPARVAYEAGTPMALGELAVRGLGVAVLPESVVEFVPGLVAVTLTRPALPARIDLVWASRRPTSPAGRALVAHLRRGLTQRQRPPARGTTRRP